ncbi:MAG: serine phosphatase [Acidobacteria bacterium]|nr:serine phosphatase [Acidobacteriota bacterium]
MGWFTLVLVGLWAVWGWMIPASMQRSFPAPLRLFLNLLTFLLIVPAAYYTWSLLRVVRARLLWKIRRRLIIAHILIGAIPIVLLLVILYVSGLLFFYQLSYFLVEKQIGIHTAQIHAFSLSLSSGLQQSLAGSASAPSELKTMLEQDARYLLSMYRAASVVLRARDPATGGNLVFSAGRARPDPDAYQLPRWLSDREWNGLVYEDMQPAIYGLTPRKNERPGMLCLRSLVYGELRPEMPYSLEVTVPFDAEMLRRLRDALGQDLLLADHVPSAGLNVVPDTTLLSGNILFSTFEPEAGAPPTARPVWSMPLYPVSWDSGTILGQTEPQPDADVLFMELSTSKLMQNVFRSESNVSRTILGALQLVVGFFLAVELLSLVAGILITKSITNAVYNLDRGTEFIRRGDFSQRIVVKSEDQLGALAKSFNQMTEYIQTLVKERVQKERLERELEIAKEVQEQLFPKQAPQLKLMELTGLCLPARIVSGDYYDFLQFDSQRIGMALGDICGKGISAALLMANLQATLRSNVLAGGAHSHAGQDGADGGVAAVVRVLNQQIYAFTSANKFASFFYAVYDETRSTMTYCNAGHNPPLFFNKSGFRRLTTGGTVVGIFPDAEFEQETVHLESGDLLLAYTDGIVESVNEYGEEFGEQRLIRLVEGRRNHSAEQLQNAIVDEVLHWAYEEERDDDMTLIVARCR